MSEAQPVWALILAAGDGSRLRAPTPKPCGAPVPKQFCSLDGGRSLLEEAIQRAARLVPSERICTIVAQQHRKWWIECRGLAHLPQTNLIVQPRNRGTGVGVLFSILHILAKDPEARIVMLPSDHYVQDELVLQQALETALARLEEDTTHPILLGTEPDELDTELGYVLPGVPDVSGSLRVERFLEKPKTDLAAELIARGGLWNMFILAAHGAALLDLFLPHHSSIVVEMQVILTRFLQHGAPTGGWPAIVDLYTRLPSIDFSRDVLEHKVDRLRVVRVPSCGWSDLGTPGRVGKTLQRLHVRRGTGDVTAERESSEYLGLAAQQAQLERTRRLGVSRF